MKTKYAKLVVKDAAGSILQILPETYVDMALDSTSNFPIANSAVASTIESLGISGNGPLSIDKIPNLDASKITSGTIDIARLPAGALERMVVVANQAARFALTSSDVQIGDVVKQTDTNTMYYVKDATQLNSAAGYEEYSGGTASSVPWSGVTSKPATLAYLDNVTSDIQAQLNAKADAGSVAKEVGILSVEPTTSNTSSLDNEGLVFWSEGTTAGAPAGSPVLLSGNQTIEGQKKFLGGLYGGAYTMGTAEWAFDLTKATFFTKTVTSSGTFSFTNVPEATACCITVILVNGGNYTIHWPSSVKWSENVTPTLTQNGTDVFTFVTCTGGNVWYGTTTCIGVTA